MRTLTLSLMALALAGALAAAPQTVGVVTKVSGKVVLYTADKATGKELLLGKALSAGDRIKTGSNGRAGLVLSDGTQLKINYNTDITLRDKDSKGHASDRGIASIKIALGDLWAKVTRKNSKLEFDTPAAVAAVKGTEPIIGVTEDGNTCVKLRSGEILMTNPNGSLTLDPKEQVCVSPKGPLNDGMKTAWDAQSATFEKEFDAATGADVGVQYKDAVSGQVKTLNLDYGK